MMASPDLKTFEELVTLSSLAVDALTRWDDVTDKLDDNPALLTVRDQPSRGGPSFQLFAQSDRQGA